MHFCFFSYTEAYVVPLQLAATDFPCTH